MSTVTSISRADLIDICERLLAEHPELPAVWADELREVARTVTRIRGDAAWWSVDDECGCLVGSVTHGPPSLTMEGSAHDALVDIGCEYCGELDRVLGSVTAPAVLTVTEEDTA